MGRNDISPKYCRIKTLIVNHNIEGNRSSIHSLILGVFILLMIPSCKQSEPDFRGRDGDFLTFSGMTWEIKHANIPLGPGPNFFSDHPNDVWIDEQDYLHLSVHSRGDIWFSTEVISVDTFGYGTYVFTIQGDMKNIDKNIVLGLFTWDNNTFQEQANSEVDIEFAKWGVDTVENTLQYGVQPINFGPYYPERDDKPDVDSENWIGVSTHAFTWTDTLITWGSWVGPEYGNGPPLASWSFNLDNPARIKNENGNSSDPIIIPAPGNTTNARMNMWLVNGSAGPFDKFNHEVIIQNFQFIPL
jgi:hypothetical protein